MSTTDAGIETNHIKKNDIKEIVKEKYGHAALRVTTGGSSCCAPTVRRAAPCWPSP